VAAQGLAKLDDASARAALHRLASDSAEADTLNGCIGGRATVASFVPAVLR
jgi:hypothetical protein